MKILRNNIDLAGSVLAGYSIVYKTNLISSISTFEDITDKSFLRPHSFEFFHQQNNLVFIDFRFPNILADLALDVYFDCRNSIKQYIDIKLPSSNGSSKFDNLNIHSLFEKFFYYLFFSDISSLHYSVGAINTQVIYKIDNGSSVNEFNYLTYDNQFELLLPQFIARINFEKCYIFNDEVILNLEVLV